MGALDSVITFLLPFKGLAKAKSRWELEEERRQTLLWQLLEHNLTTVAQVVGADSTFLVSPDVGVFERYPAYAHWQCPGEGLNRDLEHARSGLKKRLAGKALAVLLPDLPDLCKADVEAMLESASRAEVTLCPDTQRVGTNGLVLAPEVDFPYLFEGASFQRHHERAVQLGLTVAFLERPGLGRDADHSSDLLRSPLL